MSRILLLGRVIDAVGEEPMEKGAVLAEDGKIIYTGPAEGCPTGASSGDIEVIEAGEGTILPGFIDVHAHLCGDEDAGSYADGKLFGDQLIGAVKQVGILLDAGFTGIRDMSESGFYLARGVRRGAIRGPKIMPGGKVLSCTSGHVDMRPDMTPEEFNRADHLSRTARVGYHALEDQRAVDARLQALIGQVAFADPVSVIVPFFRIRVQVNAFHPLQHLIQG